MAANSSVQFTELDFDNIKTNLKTFLQSQNTLKDYNYDGSALSVLLDVLAYNTQYQAFYLNQVANEMFLDSALQRSSVISHAKLLNYTPKSAIAPAATVNVTVNQVSDSSLTLPAYTNFLSESIDGTNYNFLTVTDTTVNVVANTATFNNVTIKEGTYATSTFTVDSATNPKYLFQIPNANVDTTTLQVRVQQSISNSSYAVYTAATNYLTLGPYDNVYFLQEGLNGYYEIYFGDGVLGNKLINGNVVKVSYIITNGNAAAGANSFVLMDSVSRYSNTITTSITKASQGGDKESIDQIKYHAPKSFSAQNRAVTKNDYITLINQNNLGIQFDAVNVWGGEENNPPVYGQVYVCLKPAGSYTLTQTQKQLIINQVIKPVSVLTVTPTIIDPDYTYIQLTVNVFYDPALTTLSSAQIQSGVKSAISNFAASTLNTFNSTFNAYDLLSTVQKYDPSIITSEYTMQLQKKFFPILTNTETYNLYYNTPLERGILLSGVNSFPAMQFRSLSNLANIIEGVYIQEIPETTNGIASISVTNPGHSYTATPKVTILGDGTGATAHAVIVNGSIRNIVVDTPGSGYTAAIVTITNATNDTTGSLGSATATLTGQFGTIETYYYNTTGVKTILDSKAGTIDYTNGIITLNNFSPYNIDNPLGQLTVSVKPTTSIISSTYNGIITVDSFDPNAIVVNVTAKTSRWFQIVTKHPCWYRHNFLNLFGMILTIHNLYYSYKHITNGLKRIIM